jgi:hypothetical protein
MRTGEGAYRPGPKRVDPIFDPPFADCTLYGPPEAILEGLEAWYAAGVNTPILVPSSAVGNQMKAFEELFELFDQ